MPDGLPPLRDVIEKHGLKAKKSLGQNFILDLNLTAKIARLAGRIEGSTVVEVGPGPGGLTRALLNAGAARVIAVERDDRCLPALDEISALWPGKLTILSADALGVDWRQLVEDHSAGNRVIVVANLPYGIATKLLAGWLETEPWPPWFDGLALMFQREVADRIVAAPGTKAYGRLSVLSQWRTHCEIVMRLGPDAFTPPPKVASAVVQFAPRIRLEPHCSVRRLSAVSMAAFGQRRKMLRVTLKPVFSDPEKVLEELGIEPTMRGEMLSVEQIASIAEAADRYQSAS